MARQAQPQQRLDQLALTAAFDARDADDLGGVHQEGGVADGELPHVVDDHELLDGQDRLARLLDCHDPRPDDGLAQDEAREAAVVRLGRRHRRYHAASPHDGHPARHGEDLPQLVGDEEDRAAFPGKDPENGEQLVGLLGRKDAGRLVEDQDVRLAIEQPHDLEPLSCADRQVRYRPIPVDLRLEPARQGACRGEGVSPVEEDPVRGRDGTEHKVLEGRELVDKLEPLMDHPDAEPDRVGRTRYPGGDAIKLDGALIRLDKTVDRPHERRLAGAVLADDGVDPAAFDLQIDAIVRQKLAIALREPSDHDPRRRARRGPVAGIGGRRLARRLRAHLNQSGLPSVIVFQTLISPLRIFWRSSSTF
jgi:hypothetical protein